MTIYTAFRCPIDLLAKAKAKSARDRRSLSNFIITLIEKDVADIPSPAKAKPAKAKPAKAKPAKKAKRP